MAKSLLSSLLGSMTSDSSVSSLSHKTGLSSAAINALVQAALPLLLRSLTQNASSSSGLSSLIGALGQHTSKKSIEEQIGEADVEDGEKIVGHIFGSNTSDVLSQLSKETGIEKEKVNELLGSMAPAMMSTLSAATAAGKDSKADVGSLGSIVGGLAGGNAASAVSAVKETAKEAAKEKAKETASSGLGSIIGGLGGILGGAKEEKKEEKKEEAVSASNDGTDLLSALLGFKL